MKKEIVESLLTYITEQLINLEAPCSTIRLIKYLYLIDIEYYKKHKRTLTEIEWVRYKFGPYFFAMPTIMKSSLGFEYVEKPTENGFSRTFRPTKHHDISKVVDFSTEKMIQKIIEKWANAKLDELLKHVYDTRPMKAAEFCKPLDFTTLEVQVKVVQRQWHIHLNSEDSIKIQTLLENRKKDTATRKTQYDALYYEALEVMDKDESNDAIITGKIKIDFSLDDLFVTNQE